jgi:hypothetical protein
MLRHALLGQGDNFAMPTCLFSDAAHPGCFRQVLGVGYMVNAPGCPVFSTAREE